jgi:signal transduction histidine kinase
MSLRKSGWTNTANEMAEKTENLLSALRSLVNNETVDISALNEEEGQLIGRLIEERNESKELKNAHSSLKERLEILLDILVEFAQFNFDMEIPLSDEADELDGIALGLQTLGQEVDYYQKQLKLANDNLTEAQAMANIGSWEIHVPSMEMNWSDQLYKIYNIAQGSDVMEEIQNRVDTKDNALIMRLFERAIKYHEPYQITFKANVNGELKYIDAQAKPIILEGEVSKVVGTAMDVTNRVLAEEKMKALNLELEQKVIDRTKDLEGFSYSVSHDLRAPLRSIIGFSNILEETHADQLNEEAKRLINIIVKNASKMSTLIEELLTFSRVGVTVAKFDPLDLNVIIENTWRESLSEFEGKEKVKMIKQELPEVYGSQTMIHQVFLNLFSNALKYSSKKSEIFVEIEIVEKGDHFVEFSIKDNGCGFDMKYLDKLFGVFQRLHSEDEYSGTGVGLALVKRILDKHQGSISAVSEVDEGATFFVKLPIVDPTVL